MIRTYSELICRQPAQKRVLPFRGTVSEGSHAVLLLMGKTGTTSAQLERMNPTFDRNLESARNLVAGGNYREAADTFRELFDERPDSPEVLLVLAGAMENLGQTDSALALMADSIDEADPNPATLQRIADQLSQVGRMDEAADFLLCALACAPTDSALRSRTEGTLTALGRTAQLAWLASGAEGEMPPA